MKLDLKANLEKLVSDYRADGKLYEKITYQSIYFNLKQTAELLGIKSKDLTNLDSTVMHQRIHDQREQLKEVIHFVDDEINELEVNINFLFNECSHSKMRLLILKDI